MRFCWPCSSFVRGFTLRVCATEHTTAEQHVNQRQIHTDACSRCHNLDLLVSRLTTCPKLAPEETQPCSEMNNLLPSASGAHTMSGAHTCRSIISHLDVDALDEHHAAGGDHPLNLSHCTLVLASNHLTAVQQNSSTYTDGSVHAELDQRCLA